MALMSGDRYVVVFTQSPFVGPVLCFFLFESLWCLNEVAKELENPFGAGAKGTCEGPLSRIYRCVLGSTGYERHLPAGFPLALRGQPGEREP